MDAPNEFQPLMDEIFREKVLRARAEKLAGVVSLGGLDLFESVLSSIRAGVRHERPGATDDEIEQEVRRRLAIKRRLDEHGFFLPAT